MGEVLTIREHKTAHRGKDRLIFLSRSAKRLLTKQARRRPNGLLLRTDDGVRWSKDSWGSLFRRLRERTGISATAYAYRRAYAVRAIESGLSIEQVAGLLGNTSTVALRHYVDLSRRLQMLKAAAERV